ncbi:hypothetical protein LTR66_003401 [Elasticomyces elasticus]|nr:hypothetical protein LTR50_004107 [Elasticomyces elasticus]KAK4997145.1 hypothetical protein LTR66_003401 [Elasticomyces elasticus]KAK5003109.1 hypothetical protein LTR28_010582 [Elasticomyces elasticus]
MASFMEPIQIFSTLAAAANFGGSILQSPLIMPMLMLPQIPVQYAGTQTAYLLQKSEYFFPPLNGVCTLSNLVLMGTAYLYSSDSAVAAAKLPRLATAFVLNLATTAWALTIMVPMNKRMGVLAGQMEKKVKEDGQGAVVKTEESELRRLQARWRKLNYGRATIMIGSAIAGMSALLVRA